MALDPQNSVLERHRIAKCTNALSHVQICIAVCGNPLEARNCKYKLLTKSDADFHNMIIAYLFNYMHVNGFCIFTVVTNKVINNKLGGTASKGPSEVRLPMPKIIINKKLVSTVTIVL
jgi:hypothetical protein